MTLSRASDNDGYFESFREADEWLDFEASAEEREKAFYAENDRYTEWQRWQREWEAGA